MNVILADPYMTGYSGHCYAYFRALGEAIEARGHRCILVGNEASPRDFLRVTGVEPGFSENIRERRWRMGLLRAGFARNLADLATRFDFGPQTHLVLNSLRYFHLQALADWMASLPASRRPQVDVILHFTSLGPDGIVRRIENGYRQGFAALASVPGGGVRLLADTAELVAELGVLSALPIELAPIPPSVAPQELPGPDGRASGAALNIAFAGEARWDKGFHLLAEAAAEVAPDIAAGRAAFRVQAHNPEARTLRFRRTIAALRRSGAMLLEQPLGADAYADFIAAADILVIPYNTAHYDRQSSGIFVEALVSGKIVVTSAESWMGKQVVQRGGGVTFRRDEPEGLRRSLRTAIGDFPRLQRESIAIARAARAFHSAENLASLLLSRPKAAGGA